MRTERYRDREDAAAVLSSLLEGVVLPPAVIAGIPRGGAMVAAPIARRLHLPLTLAFARKLSLPETPELAFGALDEDGEAVMDTDRLRDVCAHPQELWRARDRVAREIRRQQREFPADPLAALLPERTVVLVDDGLATGYTMRAALRHARRHAARRIVVAVPCSSGSAARQFEREADAFVCPWVDEAFIAVGAYYEDFAEVGDGQVREVLREARERGEAAGPVTGRDAARNGGRGTRARSAEGGEPRVQ